MKGLVSPTHGYLFHNIQIITYSQDKVSIFQRLLGAAAIFLLMVHVSTPYNNVDRTLSLILILDVIWHINDIYFLLITVSESTRTVALKLSPTTRVTESHLHTLRSRLRPSVWLEMLPRISWPATPRTPCLMPSVLLDVGGMRRLFKKTRNSSHLHLSTRMANPMLR